MRVTNASTYRNFTSSVNNVHLTLNKAMNKISSGAAYEAAAENPLAYYEGKKLDNQYQDTLSKLSLLKDLNNRIYQQELGPRNIQTILNGPGGAENQVQFAMTATTTGSALESAKLDLQQKQQEIVDSLNAKYEDYYIYGGNDLNTTPFSLNYEGSDLILTYKHTFPGDKQASEVAMKWNTDTSKFEIQSASSPSFGTGEEIMKAAMMEQGRVDVGYGSITDRKTLLDTYTGGLNILTGFTSEEVINGALNGSTVLEYLNQSPIALVGRAVQAIDNYQNDKFTRADMETALGETLDDMKKAERVLSTVYSDLGNKYRLVETTEDRLKKTADALVEQYKDKLGADPYEAIMEMYNNQYAYNAALQVGSKLMSSSLFDFM